MKNRKLPIKSFVFSGLLGLLLLSFSPIVAINITYPRGGEIFQGNTNIVFHVDSLRTLRGGSGSTLRTTTWLIADGVSNFAPSFWLYDTDTVGMLLPSINSHNCRIAIEVQIVDSGSSPIYYFDTSELFTVFNYNVEGIVYLDNNQNAVHDLGEPIYNSGRLSANPFPSTSTLETRVLSSELEYNFTGLASGVNTIKYILTDTNYKVVPDSYLVDFTISPSYTAKDFAIQPKRSGPNLEVSYYRAEPLLFAPFYSKIRVINTGTSVASSCVLILTFDESKEVPNAITGVNSLTPGRVSWILPSLAPGSVFETEFMLRVTASPGVILDESVYIDSFGSDLYAHDNRVNVSITSFGAMDPNDCHAVPDFMYETSSLNPDYITYKIRFQNTGNYPASNIIVIDSIPSQFNKSTIQMIETSHSANFIIKDNKVMEWHFPGINLPDSVSDEPNSHGYVIFKVKPMNGMIAGQQIVNFADIYFDYNPPVRTPDCFFRVLAPSGFESIENEVSIQVFPNPSVGEYYVRCSEPFRQVRVYDMKGAHVFGMDFSGHSDEKNTRFDISNLNQGVYVIKVITEKGTYTEKIYKSTK